MDFVKTPYLPKKRAVLAVGDVKIEGVRVITPFESERVHKSLKKHADLTFCYLGEGVAVCEKEAYDYYKEELSFSGITLLQGESLLDLHYPFDAAYNVAITGKKIFCRIASTDKVLLNTARELGYEIIDIKQGYAKCSVCPVGEFSAISADMSFVKKAENEGIEVLQITNNTISLPGFSNGFFGGSAFMADEHTLFVNGDLSLHPDCEKIKSFLKKREIEAKCLSEFPIYDFGSFIPIIEE